MRKIQLSETQILALQMKFNERKHELRRWVYFPTPVRVPFANGLSYVIEGYAYLLLTQIEQIGASGKLADTPCQFSRDFKFSEDGFTIRLYRKNGIYLVRLDCLSLLEKEGVAEAVEVVGNGFDENYLAVLTPPPYKSDRLTPQEIETLLQNVERMAEIFRNKEEAVDLISKKLL